MRTYLTSHGMLTGDPAGVQHYKYVADSAVHCGAGVSCGDG